jgi:membrane carboxypeptidase/penicillin-binding protein PbpC
MAPPGVAVEEPETTYLEIDYPPRGARFIIDPSIPREFQTIGLQAQVEPRVTEVVWYVDGEEYARAEYPYTVRWQLEPGDHSVQVRFPNAFVQSGLNRFTVLE